MSSEPLTIVMTIDADAERVWQALTTKTLLQHWFSQTNWPITPAGETSRADTSPSGPTSHEHAGIRGHILHLDPGTSLRATWQREHQPETTEIEVTVTSTLHGSTVTVVHDGLLGDDIAQHEQLWRDCLERLATYLYSTE